MFAGHFVKMISDYIKKVFVGQSTSNKRTCTEIIMLVMCALIESTSYYEEKMLLKHVMLLFGLRSKTVVDPSLKKIQKPCTRISISAGEKRCQWIKTSEVKGEDCDTIYEQTPFYKYIL